ncbi:MAG: hypothetical protein A3E37_03045 [Candidatus Andersenbacteria bacterium RIFCSPHIGHO2_12_FULL_46_9]|nr:MAG: hypothetical protein UW94_C0018G0002 [Parcubacteria group bacterium GW2011_GWA2_45_14]OGY35554.1 MAG: hypothetical protein A3E37_03045 [Candidatus Andersenbacteria bacterium RIFCSPHIGHO2_12_FULL_46_9]OGY38341.1 MAG: hypothetical protein A3I08_03780 [Candidatus Andersenbacteria bacterium RIFCSPLOWO2_02_FULL_46_11]
MYNSDEYKNLTLKYSSYASWAIWSYKNQSDSTIISQNISELHSKFVLLGLNISRPLANEQWSNFHHGPNNIRKLKYACNDNKLHGSYITDIFKGIIEPEATQFRDILTDKIINENVNLFNQEMGDIKIDDDSQFIIFGTKTSLLAQCFNDYFKQEYKNKIIYHYHYSYYGLTDKKWVNVFWKKLGISQNFDLTVKKYK